VELDHLRQSRSGWRIVVVVVGPSETDETEIVVGRGRCWPTSGQISPLLTYFLFTLLKCFLEFCGSLCLAL